jgi:hypothetical protein
VDRLINRILIYCSSKIHILKSLFGTSTKENMKKQRDGRKEKKGGREVCKEGGKKGRKKTTIKTII